MVKLFQNHFFDLKSLILLKIKFERSLWSFEIRHVVNVVPGAETEDSCDKEGCKSRME